MEITYKNISELKFADYNPRHLSDEQRQSIKESIERYGIVDPIIINTHPDRNNVVIGGEQRTKVAGEDLGYEQVPCYEINLEFEQEKELNIRLNKNSGEWDFEALEHFFDVESLMDWGFKESELAFLNEEDVNLDDFFEDKEEGGENGKSKLVLEYNQEEYEKIMEALEQYSASKEQVIYKLLVK